MFLARSLGLIAVVLLLVACDKPSPSTASVKPVSPVEKQKIDSVKPADAVEVIETRVQPISKPEPKPVFERPAAKSAPPTQASQPKSKVALKGLSERVPLELGLHPDVFDPIAPQALSEGRRAKLLPPLFDEKPEPESSFQLNGKLITNDQIRGDYWDSVEGAQLEFEFKQ